MPASQSLDPGAKLRRLLSRKGATAVPGVFNPAVALLAEEAGFECLYLSGCQRNRYCLSFRLARWMRLARFTLIMVVTV